MSVHSVQLTYLKRDYITCLPNTKNTYKSPKTCNHMKASNARNSMFNSETRSMEVNLKSRMVIQSCRSFMLMEGKNSQIIEKHKYCSLGLGYDWEIMVIAENRNIHISSDLFNYLKNCKNYRKSVLNIICVIHFSLQLLSTTFFCLINIWRIMLKLQEM
jgi:hypothetical protein